MCACIQNGILRNGQQSQSVVNGFIDQSEFAWEILPVLNIWQLHALPPLSAIKTMQSCTFDTMLSVNLLSACLRSSLYSEIIPNLKIHRITSLV